MGWRQLREVAGLTQLFASACLEGLVNLELRHVIVAEEGGQEGRLAFLNGELVAVLVLLSQAHDDLAGHWYVEAGFGKLANSLAPKAAFPDLEAARAWLEEC